MAADRSADLTLLASIVDQIPGVLFRYRLQPRPRYEYISASVERITGYSPEEFYADPNLDVRIVHPEDRPVLLEAIALRREGVMRLRWVHRDGGTVWLDVNVSTVRESSGEIVALEGTARDVTAQIESDGRPRSEGEVVRTLMNITRDPILLCDRDGLVIECNEAFAKVFGRPREEVVGRPIYERWPDVARRRLPRIRRAIRSGRPVRFDEQVGDRHYNVAVQAVLDDSGRVGAIAVFGHDVSRSKRVEMRLRQNEERLRFFYQDNPSMYFTVDASGMVLSVNKFGARQLGYEPKELLNRPVLEVFHPEDRHDVERQLRRCMDNMGALASWEFRKVRKDGEIMWVKEVARATQSPDGSVVVLIVCEDITERKQMEEELQRVREEIESKVEETLEEKGNRYGLTFRQLTVLHLVAQGKSDKEIGVALGISPLTVNTHVSRALRKMGASSRTEAGVRALREGLIR